MTVEKRRKKYVQHTWRWLIFLCNFFSPTGIRAEAHLLYLPPLVIHASWRDEWTTTITRHELGWSTRMRLARKKVQKKRRKQRRDERRPSTMPRQYMPHKTAGDGLSRDILFMPSAACRKSDMESLLVIIYIKNWFSIAIISVVFLYFVFWISWCDCSTGRQ